MARSSNPWLDRGVFHWAHQGGAREAPSNTLHAMAKGREAGADGLELDVHRSADGQVVLIHDTTLERTTNGSGAVAEHTLEELRSLDAAYWWVPGEVDDHDAPPERYVLRGRAPADPALRIPTLEELLELHPSAPLTIEVKARGAVEPLVAVLRGHGRRDDVIVTSFKDSVVRELRKQAPELSLAPGKFGSLWFWLRTLVRWPPRRSRYVALQVPTRFKWLRVVDERFLRAAHRCGLAVHVWTIDGEQEMRDLVALGVDGIMTDRPSVLAAVLRAQQA
ncbi:MAG TPA: glycerophosphodiester phosphodiesterase [Acidimicrobiales bacterium]|nr:glycerophosphodiester phosphodiesterase [Acidimicrobiales bacterium]